LVDGRVRVAGAPLSHPPDATACGLRSPGLPTPASMRAPQLLVSAGYDMS
jgi:hypothetical protein